MLLGDALRCVSCGALYWELQPGGLQNFHVCPAYIPSPELVARAGPGARARDVWIPTPNPRDERPGRGVSVEQHGRAMNLSGEGPRIADRVRATPEERERLIEATVDPDDGPTRGSPRDMRER